MFLEISKNSQESTCARVSFLIKLEALGLRPATSLKKKLWHRCFPVNCEISKNIFFTEHLWTAASKYNKNLILILSIREGACAQGLLNILIKGLWSFIILNVFAKDKLDPLYNQMI